MTGKLIPVNGHHLNIDFRGPEDGLPVVLLHHGLGSGKSWKAQIPVLAEAGYRVIAYDRWGYGGSDPREYLSMPYFKEDLEDLQTVSGELGYDQISLVGHSDGGTISLYYAAQNPARVACLVTTAAHIYIEDKMIPGIQGVQQAFTQDMYTRAGLRRLHGDKVDAVFQGWYRGWTKPEHLDWDMSPKLVQILCPTLVIQGIEDEHATPKHAQDIAAAIPNAELWLEPGIGHMLPQDISEKFNRKVIGFLETNYVQQGSHRQSR